MGIENSTFHSLRRVPNFTFIFFSFWQCLKTILLYSNLKQKASAMRCSTKEPCLGPSKGSPKPIIKHVVDFFLKLCRGFNSSFDTKGAETLLCIFQPYRSPKFLVLVQQAGFSTQNRQKQMFSRIKKMNSTLMPSRGSLTFTYSATF